MRFLELGMNGDALERVKSWPSLALHLPDSEILSPSAQDIRAIITELEAKRRECEATTHLLAQLRFFASKLGRPEYTTAVIGIGYRLGKLADDYEAARGKA